MNFKPYLSNDVKKLEDAQVKQEEAIKAALLASLKEVSDQILPYHCMKLLKYLRSGKSSLICFTIDSLDFSLSTVWILYKLWNNKAAGGFGTR